MDLETTLLILAVLGTILFLVALVMSYKSWRWHTMLLVGLVFVAGAVATWMSVETLKVHQSWRGILFLDDLGGPVDPKLSIQFDGPTGLIEKTEKLRKENYELEFGKEDSDGNRKGGIVQLQSQLAEVLLDRGRLWNDAQPLSLSEDNVLILEVAQPKTYRIEEKVPLYIFGEKTPMEGGRYLGMFLVEKVIGNTTDEETPPAPDNKVQVTLRPGWPISPEERNRLSASVDNKDKWRLYDKTPVDRHRAFAGLEADDMKIDEELFSTLNREELLRKIIPTASVEEFIEDHQTFKPAEFTSVKDFVENYSEEKGKYPRKRIEVKVEFIEDYSPDEDAEDEENQYFAKGQEVWLLLEDSEETRNSLDIMELLDDSQEGGAVIELLDEEENLPRYSRRLRDYAYLFRDLYRKRQRQSFEIDEKIIEINAVEQVIGEKQEVIDRFEEEKGRLMSDAEQFVRDQKTIQTLTDSMDAQRKAADTAVRTVREQTIELGKKINLKQLKAVKEIDRRSPDPGTPAGAG